MSPFSAEIPVPLSALSLVPETAAPPTGIVVILHGWGADASDLAPLGEALGLPQFQYFFVNAPFPHPQVPQGRAWYNLEDSQFEGLAAAREALISWLTQLSADIQVPLERFILGGFSQGGAMSLDVGLSLPLAGVFSLSGYLHFQPQPQHQALPPYLLIHGRFDQVVPFPMAQQAVQELQAIGVTVEFHELGMGHEILPEELAILKTYLLSRLEDS